MCEQTAHKPAACGGAVSPVLSLQWQFCRLRDSQVSQFKREEAQLDWPHWPRASGPRFGNQNETNPGGRSPPDLASVEARFENYVRSCVSDTGNRSAKFSNLASTGMKPVGGRKTSGTVRLVVGKPGCHRHEAGWGTLDSVHQTIRSGIQIVSSSRSINTEFRFPPLSTDWTDRTLRFVQQLHSGEFFAFQHRQTGSASGADV